MSDTRKDREFDQIIGSILREGTEPVPDRVWARVSGSIPTAPVSSKKLWIRYVAVISSVAAVLTIGLLFGLSDDSFDVVPQEQVSAEVVAAFVEKSAVDADVAGDVADVHVATADVVGEVAAFVEKSAVAVFVPDAADVSADVSDDVDVADAADGEDIVIAETNDNAGDVADVHVATADAAIAGVTTSEIAATSEVAVEDSNVDLMDGHQIYEEVYNSDARNDMSVSVVLSGLTGVGGEKAETGLPLMKRPAYSPSRKYSSISEKGTDSSYGLPISFGIGAKLNFTPKWALSVGVNYTLLTRTFSGVFQEVDDAGNSLPSVDSDIRNFQHYIGIPINAYYNIINNRIVNFYAYAGGAVDFCVADQYRILQTSQNHYAKPVGTQWSANLGVGVEFLITKKFAFYLDPSLRYYFKSNSPKNVRTMQPFMFGCELGFRFNI